MLPTPPLQSSPPFSADERHMLTSFLDRQRELLLRKVGGLPPEGLTQAPVPPSTISLLALLKHAAAAERYWFRITFAGEDIDPPWTNDDPDADWRIESGDTPVSLHAAYLDEVDHARKIVAEASLDDVAANPSRGRPVTLRWILVHMIEEVARHVGHADLIRERLDGTTGD